VNSISQDYLPLGKFLGKLNFALGVSKWGNFRLFCESF
jgi:hypothetical protein